ncbi:hypothetical protein MNBD_ACTINO02-574 [hydrothermal vent metagenome]|uniref:Lipoprotein n=1 Tax=hydrothermal vent metagenome TaxID=652676 RepID=A0A3B0SV16_9ZZZZ
MSMRFKLIVSFMAVVLVTAACASGPSASALESARPPSTTTTTQAAAEGVVVVKIEDGRISPSILRIDPDEFWIVQFVHKDDPERAYEILFKKGEFPDSPVMNTGDIYEIDLRDLTERKIVRYRVLLEGSLTSGLPGTINTRG